MFTFNKKKIYIYITQLLNIQRNLIWNSKGSFFLEEEEVAFLQFEPISIFILFFYFKKI